MDWWFPRLWLSGLCRLPHWCSCVPPQVVDGGGEPLVQRRLGIDTHTRHHRHAGAQGNIGRWIVDDDLHRHALDDLDVVARRVFRWKQREPRPTPTLNARDVAANG